MSRHNKLWWAALVLLTMVGFGPRATAQIDPFEICDPTENITLAECERAADKYADKLIAEEDGVLRSVRQQVEETVGETLAIKNTGTDSAMSNVTSVTDFVSRLAVSAQGGSLLGEGEDKLTLDLNRFLGISTDDGYKLTAELRKATVSSKLLEQFSEDSRVSKASALGETLGDFDDVLLGFTYSPTTAGLFGRTQLVVEALWDALFESAKAQAEVETAASDASERGERQNNLVSELAEEYGDLVDIDEPGNLSLSELYERSPEKAGALVVATIDDRISWQGRRTAMDRVLKLYRFADLADLVDNQRQLNISGSYLFRNELVGPDETHGKLTYEHGFVNVRTLRKYLVGCLDEVSDAAELDSRIEWFVGEAETEQTKDLQPWGTKFLTCYQGFFTQERLAAMKAGNRFAVSVEYADVDRHLVDLPDDDVTLDLAGDEKVIGSLTYGRYLNFDDAAGGRTRIDFNWSYEKVDNEELRNTRSILQLNFAHRVAGDLVLSAGLEWANKPEFLTDVDEELSARLGLRYALFNDTSFGK